MIDAWKEIAIESAGFYIGWGGLLIGLAFGFIVYRTNFCTMGSISDILTFGDYRRFRSWLLAGATAILGVMWLEGAGVADMSMSMYLSPSFGWGGNVVGGLIFGFGMVFAGGCLGRNLVRAGSGDLRSIVVLMIAGIFAYITIGGMLGPARVVAFTPLTADLTALGMADQRTGSLLAAVFGLDGGTANRLAGLVVAGAILVYCFADRSFRTSPRPIVGGVGIGLCVVAGWLLTGLAYDEFADNPQLVSLTYTRPLGDTLEYFMRFTALGAPAFAVVTTLGALAGGTLGALSVGRLHMTTFADKSDTLRNMFGAALMGIGGVVALGCTIGQAITGFSTLAMGSIITFAFIVLGGVIGMKTMENLA